MKRLFIFLGVLGALVVSPVFAGSGTTPEMRACYAKLMDHYVIADARMKGMTKGELIAAAQEKLEAERQTRALELIEQAYAAEDAKAWFHGYWLPCLEGGPDKTNFQRIAFEIAASSQKLYCDAVADVAESMARDFAGSEFRAEHYQNDFQQELAKRVTACQKAGEPVRACVIRRCMGAGA